MMRTFAFSEGKPALMVFTLLLTAVTVRADKPRPYPFRGSNAFDVGRFAPSTYGYPLDDYAAGYYGGGRYQEYYNYSRGGWSWSIYPGPLPGPGLPPDYRGSVRPRLLPHAELSVSGAATVSPLLQGNQVAHIKVEVPAGAEVSIDGHRTRQKGTTRLFVTPPLGRGEEFLYDVRARWNDQGQMIEQQQRVRVRAGDITHVVFPTQADQRGLPRPFPVPAAP